MNELSNLMIDNIKAKYTVNTILTPEEYKLLLFAIEDRDRLFNKHVKGYESFLSLKKKMIENHELFNS